jgi:hypothetical protein
LHSNSSLIKKENVIGAVRSEEQAKSLLKLGVKVLQLDLTNEKAVIEGLLHNNGTNFRR